MFSNACNRRCALVEVYARRSTFIGEHNGTGAKPHFAIEPICKRTGWNRPNMFLDRLKQSLCGKGGLEQNSTVQNVAGRE